MDDNAAKEFVAGLFRTVLDDHFEGSQSAASRRLGFPQRTIGRWANGESSPSLADFLVIADRLGMPAWRMLRPQDGADPERELLREFCRIAEDARKYLRK